MIYRLSASTIFSERVKTCQLLLSRLPYLVLNRGKQGTYERRAVLLLAVQPPLSGWLNPLTNPHEREVAVPSLWPRPGGVLQQHGLGVLRPIDSEQANFRVARHPTTIRRSCCRELDARVEPLVFHQLIYTAVCANVSVLCMHSGAFCIAREPLVV